MADVIHEIMGPDGQVHEIMAPETATPQEIEAFAAQVVPAAAAKKIDVNAPKAALSSAVNMLPGGADAFGALAAATYGRDSPGTFGQKQVAAKEFLQEAARQGFQQHPVASFTGGAAGAIAPGLLLPAGALSGGSVLQRAGKGAGVAAGMGAAYGLGQGNTLDDRITNAITGGVMAAPFGAGGSLAADAIGAAAPRVTGAAGSLAQRAANILARNRGQAVQRSGSAVSPAQQVGVPGIAGQIQGALDQPVNLATTPGNIPLTVGQVSQSPKAQALEYGAAAGNYGDEAQRMALEVRDLQSEAAKAALGSPSDIQAAQSAQNIRATLRSGYEKAKAKTNAAYAKVGEATTDDPLKISGQYMRETVFPEMQTWLRKGTNGTGFDLNSEGWAQAKKLYNQAEAISKADKITAMNFSRLEFWRSKVTNRIAQSMDPGEKLFLGGLLERYDNAMDVLPREAIKSGDDAIVGLMTKARSLRREQGQLFEKSKIVKDILKNDDLTPEQLGNTLGSAGNRAGSYAADIIKAAKTPAMKAQVRQDLRTAVLGNILNKSLSAEVRAGSNVEGGVQKMVNFDNLAKNLEGLVKNKTLLKQIMPDANERMQLEKTLRAAQLIKSTKPGSKNYSNTAYVLLNAIRAISPAMEKTTIPLVGSVGGGVEKWAQGAATADVEKSLAPVLKSLNDEMTGPAVNLAKKYGRQAITGASAGVGIQNTPLTITEEGNQ